MTYNDLLSNYFPKSINDTETLGSTWLGRASIFPKLLQCLSSAGSWIQVRETSVIERSFQIWGVGNGKKPGIRAELPQATCVWLPKQRSEPEWHHSRWLSELIVPRTTRQVACFNFYLSKNLEKKKSVKSVILNHNNEEPQLFTEILDLLRDQSPSE